MIFQTTITNSPDDNSKQGSGLSQKKTPTSQGDATRQPSKPGAKFTRQPKQNIIPGRSL